MICPSNCVATGRGLYGGVAGVPCEFSLRVYDSKNEIVQNDHDININLIFLRIKLSNESNVYTWSAEGSSQVESRPDENSISKWKASKSGCGKYDIIYVHFHCGTYDLLVKVNGNPVSGSPFRCIIIPGPPDPAQSVVTWPGQCLAALNEAAVHNISNYTKFWIKLRGNPASPFSNPESIILFLRQMRNLSNHMNAICLFPKDENGAAIDQNIAEGFPFSVSLSENAQLDEILGKNGAIVINFKVLLSLKDLDQLARDIANINDLQTHQVRVDIRIGQKSVSQCPSMLCIQNLKEIQSWYRVIHGHMEAINDGLFQRHGVENENILELFNSPIRSLQARNCEEQAQNYYSLSEIRSVLRGKKPLMVLTRTQCDMKAKISTQLIKQEVLTKSSRWRLRTQSAGCGNQALQNLRQSLHRLSKFKTMRLRSVLKKINSKSIKSYGELIVLYQKIIEELELLGRPQCGQAIAKQFMIFHQRNVLSTTKHALQWRHKRLTDREKRVEEMSTNLERIWNNFTESVIQFTPIETSAEDALGLSDGSFSLSGASEKDREQLVKSIRTKRDAANSIREILSEAWSKHKLDEESPVRSMEEMNVEIQPVAAKFLTQPKISQANSVIILNKGCQASSFVEKDILNSPVGTLILKRRIRSGRQHLPSSISDRYQDLIALLAQQVWTPPSLREISEMERIFRSLPKLKAAINFLFESYVIIINRDEDQNLSKGMTINIFWKFVTDLELPNFMCSPIAADFFSSLFQKFSFQYYETRSGLREVTFGRLPRLFWIRVIVEIGYITTLASLVSNDAELMKQIKQTLLRGGEIHKLNMQIQDLPPRISAFHAFAKKYLIPLYKRLLQDTDNRLRVVSSSSTHELEQLAGIHDDIKIEEFEDEL